MLDNAKTKSERDQLDRGVLTPIFADRKKSMLPVDVIIHRGNSGMITFPKSKRKPLGLFPLRAFLSLLLLFFFSCAEMPVYKEEIFHPKIKQPAVTVKLLQTDESIVISPKESFVIRCFHEKEDRTIHGEPSRTIYYTSAGIRVGVSKDGIVLSETTQGEFETNLNKVTFFPQKDDSYLFLNGKPYRGALDVVLVPKNPQSSNSESLLVLNVVWVEDYLKGVVPAEIGKLGKEEMEALKAQAIAARTYSLSRLGQHEDSGYDLEASVIDQVYNGLDGENPVANFAIKETKGEVLTYAGKMIHAYFHANCGGRTEYIEKVWDKPQESYLTSIDDDEFCFWAKNYTWEETWSKEDLERNISTYLDSLGLLASDSSTSFRASLQDESFGSAQDKPLTTRGFGNLVDLIIKQRTLSGRIELLEVVTDSGAYPIFKDKIRWALKRGSDPNLILPSTLFDLEIQRGFDNSIKWVTARGHGNGHGVGMCQTGAIGMARKGYSYKEILTHYYPGVKIIKRH